MGDPSIRAAPRSQGQGPAYWRQGGKWARAFCELTRLPECLAENRGRKLPEQVGIESVVPQPPLHAFQINVYAKLRKLLGNGSGSTGLLSLPTGAGKTRVAVDAIVDHLAETGGAQDIVIWIAQSEELNHQAWECFRQVWQTPPQRTDGLDIPRRGILTLIRAWGGRSADTIEFGTGPTVLIAGIQQLGSWEKNGTDFFEDFPSHRLAAVIIDECHHVIANQHRDVLVALGSEPGFVINGACPRARLRSSGSPRRRGGQSSGTTPRYESFLSGGYSRPRR